MQEHPDANAGFPAKRIARVTLHLRNGQHVSSRWTEPKWEHTAPPSTEELHAKFFDYATPVIGAQRALEIQQAIDDLEQRPASALTDLLIAPAHQDNPAVPMGFG